jgi:hypothetical protein
MPLIALALLALSQAGCLVLAAGAVGGGAAAIGIRRGTVARSFEASVDDTTVALQSALRDLGLPIQNPRGRPNFAEIDSTMSGGGAVLMTVMPDPTTAPGEKPQARVEVHVKVFGDKQFSERLLEQVGYRLKNPTPAPPPLPPQAPTNSFPPPSPPLANQTEEPGLAPVKHEELKRP